MGIWKLSLRIGNLQLFLCSASAFHRCPVLSRPVLSSGRPVNSSTVEVSNRHCRAKLIKKLNWKSANIFYLNPLNPKTTRIMVTVQSTLDDFVLYRRHSVSHLHLLKLKYSTISSPLVNCSRQEAETGTNNILYTHLTVPRDSNSVPDKPTGCGSTDPLSASPSLCMCFRKFIN